MEPIRHRPSLPSLPPESLATRTVGPTRADKYWKLGIVVLLAVLLATSFRFSPMGIARDFAESTGRHFVSLMFWAVSAVAGIFYAAATLFYAIKYKPVPAPSFDNLPTCTVVIPAYNEGAMVKISMLSALANHYPADKLHIIAIDDGSKDDTWQYIQEVARANPAQVTAIRMEKNGGKREALKEGFLRATGEVVVTVDSDSKLARDAIRNIVAPIAADPEVAAVAGKVLVLNRYESMLTRLLAARFFITFDFSRAVQSRFGAVLCCPGALTAYRREGVLKVLEAWSTQTFMGSPCTIGEDRALTTWLLRTGYRAVYQSSAAVHTIVPTTAKGMAKMMLRWERGNVRESLVLLPLLFTPWRKKDRWWPTFDVAFDILQYPIAYVMLFGVIDRFIAHPVTMGLASAAAVGFFGLIQSFYCLRSERSTDFVYHVGYAFMAFVGLGWVFPYSCLTIRDGRWMTR